MFTGLIQQVGRLIRMEASADGARIWVEHAPWSPAFATGESVAVQGVCLTVVDPQDEQFRCDVLEETLARTCLRVKRPGAALNLERALRADDRLGGHIVTGHVDGVGRLAAIGRESGDRVLEIAGDADLLGGLVPKGSVALDGVSLTVVKVGSEMLTVHVIPFTWEHTALADLREGDALNIETDVIGKYVKRFLGGWSARREVTVDDLRAAGFEP